MSLEYLIDELKFGPLNYILCFTMLTKTRKPDLVHAEHILVCPS